MGHYKLELTIISADDLKDVRHLGNMQTYCVLWFDPRHKLSTNIDAVGGENPVWNNKFELQIPGPKDSSSRIAAQASISIEIYTKSLAHNKLVGTASIPLDDIYSAGTDQFHYRAYDIRMPSGKFQGKIHVSFRSEKLNPPPSPSSQASQTSPLHSYSRLSQASPSSILTKQQAWNDKAHKAVDAASMERQPISEAKSSVSQPFMPLPILKSHASVKPPSPVGKRVSFAPLPTKSVSARPVDNPLPKEDGSSPRGRSISTPTETPMNPLSDIREAANKLLTDFGFVKKQVAQDSSNKNQHVADQASDAKGIMDKLQGTVFAMPSSQQSLRPETPPSPPPPPPSRPPPSLPPFQETARSKSPTSEPEMQATRFNKDVGEHGPMQDPNKHRSARTPTIYNQRQAPPRPKHEPELTTRAFHSGYGPLFHGNVGRMLLS